MFTIEWICEEPGGSSPFGALTVVLADADPLQKIEKRFGKAIRKAAQLARFSGTPGQKFSFTLQEGENLQTILLLGIGKESDQPKSLRKLGFEAVRFCLPLGVEHLTIDLREVFSTSVESHVASLLVQGIELANYRYDRYLSPQSKNKLRLRKIALIAQQSFSAEETNRGQIIADCIKKARDLVNGPAELVTPTYLAQVALEIGQNFSQQGVRCTVLEGEDCAKLKMGCFLAVAQGSKEAPKFIDLHYKPPHTSAKGCICLVGKGVTFDSGGLSLKPTDAMLGMKMDMGGAAAVIAAFEGAVRLQVDWEIHCIVAATENMIGSKAYRLGDVLTASNGKTVEINNTDAEGRLTLADALTYAGKYKPTYILDFATLTGASIVALGPYIAGVMSKDEPLQVAWLAASKQAGEDMWPLPLPEELKEQLKSSIADLRNTGERFGGALTAGLFLSEFTEGQRWLHVDIAGPAMAKKTYGVTDEGGSGFAVASILQFLTNDISA